MRVFQNKKKKNIFNGKTQIEFKDAIDILHNKLINLDIFDDSDDDKSEINKQKRKYK